MSYKYNIFVRIPKCCTTTTENILAPYLNISCDTRRFLENVNNKPAINLVNHLKDVPENIINDSFIFSIVRNPYNRARSAYDYLDKINGKITFLELLKNLPDKNTQAGRHFTISSTERLSRGGKFYEKTHVLKVESYDNDMMNLCKMLNLDVKYIPMLNVNGYNTNMELARKFDAKANNKKQKVYTFSKDEMILIENIFHDDFQNFGYKKLSSN